MRKSNPVTAGQTARINQYNDLRREASASSYFQPYEQETPDLTLEVSPGNVYFNENLLEFAGDTSPTFTAPAVNPRIDVLSLNDSGVLVRTAGSEAGSPVAPAVPEGNFPICQVFNRVGQTAVLEEDDTSNGYILLDLRDFLRVRIQPDPNILIFTSNGTWNKPAGLKYIKVQLVAGGGSSSSHNGGAGGFNGGISAGGAAGGYSEKIISADDLGATETVTVGQGGLGGASGLDQGNNGASSSFGSHLSATGGTRGNGARFSSGAAFANGGLGGIGSGGDLNLRGGDGEFASGSNQQYAGGHGGASYFGGGGRSGVDSNGVSGKAPGSGAGGRFSSGNQTGTDGAAGIVKITEYFK